MESLFDALKLPEPEHPETGATDWREKPLSAKEFAEKVVASREFRNYVVNGIQQRDLPQSVMCRILDHAWGQPVKRVEVNDKTVRPYEAATTEELKARLARLTTLVSELETRREPVVNTEVDASAPVH
jgi:hypothetical protein